MRLLKTEIRSAGFGKTFELLVFVPILEALFRCFSFETLPLSILSTFWRVVLLVLRECLPESVRDRYRVCVMLLRYGPKGSGE